MLKLYNTMSRKKEEFVSIKKGSVKIYTCGPTVYWFGHAGNMRSYVLADVLKRVLTYDGYKVKHIINVTDVGHLTSDADEGEDKMEAAAAKEGKSAKEISHFYFDAFKRDFDKLNLIEPAKWTWATDYIGDQIEMIKVLEKKGFTYLTSDGVYFDSSKFEGYGKLSRKKIGGLEGGKRISLGEKRNVTDFALWKFSRRGEKRQQEWESPWGVGFPGWHIECSAMATKELGKRIDIHTGGEDNMPVHHENEIAQSECALGIHPWVKTWMHGAFLEIVGGKKMSKSAGKIMTIEQMEEKGINPLAYRYFTYSAKYRKPLTWSEGAVEGAVNSYRKLKNVCLSLEDDGKSNAVYLKEFKERIDDDLDMPGAMAVLWKLVRDEKAKGKVKSIEKMDEVFGLKLLERVEVEVPADVLKLAEEREVARKEKDWGKSDMLRDEILKKGFVVKDGKDGFELERV